MTTFKIASWNVNSLRVRLSHVLTFMASHQLDVIALQETKLPDADFPIDTWKELGYFVRFSGQRTYNGVAIVSKEEITDVITDIPGLDDPQRRVLAATVGDKRIINLYVPNGESLVSEKYRYKLNWLEKLTLFLQEELKQHSNVIILGDFNIAPDQIDVHDPAAWEGKVLFSELERQAFAGLINLGLKDCFRYLNPEAKNFSWWDYRLNGFKRNLGLRIDHVLASSKLAAACVRCHIDAEPRGWERPSDHAPIIAEFDYSS